MQGPWGGRGGNAGQGWALLVYLPQTIDYILQIGPTKGAPGWSHLGSLGRKTSTIYNRKRTTSSQSSACIRGSTRIRSRRTAAHLKPGVTSYMIG
jgi:hypothetical protein